MISGLAAERIAGAVTKPAPWFSLMVIEYAYDWPVLARCGVAKVQAKYCALALQVQVTITREMRGPARTARTSCPADSASATEPVIRWPAALSSRKLTPEARNRLPQRAARPRRDEPGELVQPGAEAAGHIQVGVRAIRAHDV